MEASQDYSFNKAHAACYALIAYRTAWLKANHPREYMAALISSVMNTKDRVPFYVNACDEMGIEVLPPDVNSSAADFAVVERQDPLRPRTRSRTSGEAAAQRDHRARARRAARSTSIWDFTERVDPQVVEQARARVARQVRRARLDRRHAHGDARACSSRRSRTGRSSQQDRLRGQASIFDGGFDERTAAAVARHHPPIPTGEFEKPELLRLEKETLGLYVSEHPLARGPRPAAPQDRLRRSPSSSAAATARSSRSAGSSPALKHLTTKKGEPMVFLHARRPDRDAPRSSSSTPRTRAARELCVTDRILVVKGRVDHKQAGRDEAHRDRGRRRSRRCAERREVRLQDRRARRRPPALIRELARLVQGLPRRVAGLPRARDVRGPEDARARARDTASQPDPDFFAEARAVLGGSAVLS